MKKYIAEIAGKDSVSAVIKFMKENPGTVVIPTIVYTGTEYGDRESYYNSVRFLKDKSKESGVLWEDTIELTDGDFGNVLCARYQYMINQKYGFYTPCIACHLFAHLMRLPLLKKVGAEGIITGERHSHQGKLKACLLYTSDAADDMQCVDLGGRRIIKKNFFKQKTAYEILRCLVGSEMCIRDSF